MPTPMTIKVTNTKERAISDTIIIADTVAIEITVKIVTIVCSQIRLGVTGVVEDTTSNKDTTKMIRKVRIVSICQGTPDTFTNLKGKSILNPTDLRASKVTIVSAATKKATAKQVSQSGKEKDLEVITIGRGATPTINTRRCTSQKVAHAISTRQTTKLNPTSIKPLILIQHRQMLPNMALSKAMDKPSLSVRLRTLFRAKYLKMTSAKHRKVSKLTPMQWSLKVMIVLQLTTGPIRLSISNKKKTMLITIATAIVVEGVVEETQYDLMSSLSMKEVRTTWTMIRKRL